MDISFYLKFWFSSKRKDLVTRRLESIYDFEGISTKLKSIKLLVFDVDDTIAEHKGKIPDKTFEFLKRMQNEGFKLAVLTNCDPKRRTELVSILGPYGVYVESTNLKPNPLGYKKVCERYGIEPGNSAMFGEKTSTDIYGAYLANYKERILVKPYTVVFGGKKSSWIERLLRFLENLGN